MTTDPNTDPNTNPMHLVGIVGSLREGSFNRSVLSTAAELAPAGVSITLLEIDAIPLYRPQLDTDGNRPESVRTFKQSIDRADGVLIATPEYNHGIPGGLKNAIDWASRPAFQSPFRDKPVGVLGASPSGVGTARAQQHLKLVMLGMASAVFPWPEYLLAGASGRIEDGRIVDETSRRFLDEFLVGFVHWVRILKHYGRNTPDRS